MLLLLDAKTSSTFKAVKLRKSSFIESYAPLVLMYNMRVRDKSGRLSAKVLLPCVPGGKIYVLGSVANVMYRNMPQKMAKEGEVQVPSTHVEGDSCICMGMTAPAVGNNVGT
ncbi:hypothetical protein JTE90_019574 [Oedothorax gibbosus]|uniref:Uncharacterized protein n=1 Tax=Oedothorax gibbosus TaxID=931172 RepID=A0AAV6V6H3_9ARAC|nr:hypothetical protein JTE90_019574 [Oedothorax gibbosus]